jgi:hypothetical protein
METETIGLIVAGAAMLFMLGIAAIVPLQNPFEHIPMNTSEGMYFTPSPTLTPHPQPTQRNTPTPSQTPTPPSTPTPEPSATPEPSPSPSPAPAWMVKGYVCEVPDRLFGEPWVEEYKFQCTCVIRGKWDLGPSFNVWEGCYSTTSSGWRRESCECVEIICTARRDLC